MDTREGKLTYTYLSSYEILSILTRKYTTSLIGHFDLTGISKIQRLKIFFGGEVLDISRRYFCVIFRGNRNSLSKLFDRVYSDVVYVDTVQ